MVKKAVRGPLTSLQPTGLFWTNMWEKLWHLLVKMKSQQVLTERGRAEELSLKDWIYICFEKQTKKWKNMKLINQRFQQQQTEHLFFPMEAPWLFADQHNYSCNYGPIKLQWNSKMCVCVWQSRREVGSVGDVRLISPWLSLILCLSSLTLQTTTQSAVQSIVPVSVSHVAVTLFCYISCPWINFARWEEFCFSQVSHFFYLCCQHCSNDNINNFITLLNFFFYKYSLF